MFSGSRYLHIIGALVLITSTAMLTLGDTVRLKDGSIIKGKIVSYNGGKFVVAMGEGSRRRELSFTAAEVESISFDDNSPASPNRNASFEKPDNIMPNPPVTKPVNNQAAPQPKTNPDSIQPISWQVKVLGDNTANGWTNTGWVVKKGQRIRISGEGNIALGRGQSTTPSGLPTLEDSQKLLKNVATGALIAVIGDDNNDFIYIGASREITATRDGALFLGINEGNLNDNSGSFNVKIEVIPDGAE